MSNDDARTIATRLAALDDRRFKALSGQHEWHYGYDNHDGSDALEWGYECLICHQYVSSDEGIQSVTRSCLRYDLNAWWEVCKANGLSMLVEYVHDSVDVEITDSEWGGESGRGSTAEDAVARAVEAWFESTKGGNDVLP